MAVASERDDGTGDERDEPAPHDRRARLNAEIETRQPRGEGRVCLFDTDSIPFSPEGHLRATDEVAGSAIARRGFRDQGKRIA